MKAMVTGASSGIGYDISKYLSLLGYDIIAVARNEERLDKLKAEIKGDIKTISMDLSNIENCKNLYNLTANEDIDVLVNNAGFGYLGEFSEADLNREVEMINTNITALHVLTKLYLKDMKTKNKGYILNVGSIAGFMPGPLMATYYASKAYVVRLTQAINRELKKNKSNVYISVLCPGPVSTRFNETAGVEFSLKSLGSEFVARYAVNKMFRKKLIILPGVSVKLARLAAKIVPDSLMTRVVFHIQKSKLYIMEDLK